jgi:polygalacturonase
MKPISSLLAVISLISSFTVANAVTVISIDSYGAVANDSSVDAAVRNSHAIAEALHKAGSGDAVLVPRFSHYYTFASAVSDIADGLQFWIEGELIASSNITAWPYDGNQYQHILQIENCNDFVLTGKSVGSIRGQGYQWWVNTVFNFIDKTRPNMVEMHNCTNVLVESLRVYNSPRFHFHLVNMTNLIVRDVYIWVDVTAQRDLSKQAQVKGASFGSPPWNLPMFPLNTDGIDPSGRNILIQNITCENYDDVVAVKPGKLLTDGCTQNVTVDGARVFMGVGMSIGSVPPDTEINCIRDVWIRNVHFINPLKAIYVKTNSGKEGFGIIDNINYQNISIDSPVLWPIYIGPQQQKEPNGGGDGIWPSPQPLVNITNILLQNITSEKGWMNAGVLRCAESNPCRGFTLDGVHVSGWASSFYVCENTEGTVTDSTPVPSCMQKSRRDVKPNLDSV